MTSPGQMPSSAPTFASPDHSFTLQAIMEMQKTVGKLEGTIVALQTSVAEAAEIQRRSCEGIEGELKAVKEKLSGVTHKLYAAGVVLAIAGVIGGWVINKSWDLISAVATPAIKEAMSTTPKPGQPSQPGQ